MRLTKRHLKRIIREEYIKLKRQGLITESTQRRRRVLKEGSVKNLLIEIEEVLFAALGSKPSGKMDMEYAIDLIMLNFPEVFVNTSPIEIEEFISDYNDVYHDIYIDPMSRMVTYKRQDLIGESNYGYGGHVGGTMAGHSGLGSEMPLPGPRMPSAGWEEFIHHVESGNYDAASDWLHESCPAGVMLDRETEEMFMGMAEEGAPPSELMSEWMAFCGGEHEIRRRY